MKNKPKKGDLLPHEVSEEIILKKYMESINCEWRHHDLRHKIRETSLFQLHLACVRLSEAFRNILT